MKIAIGAPVAERAWILQDWFTCLMKQTLQPDYFCFVYSDSQDETLDLIKGYPGLFPAKVDVYKTREPFHSRDDRGKDPKDQWRAKHMAKLRNQLRGLFLNTDADVFISLDTDVLLEGGFEIEALVKYVTSGEWDVMAPCVSLHPYGFDHPTIEQFAAYNAGWFTSDQPGDFHRPWRRADANDTYRHAPAQIHIPMAAYAIRRFAMGMSKYKAHESGEDMGFADSMLTRGIKCGWLPDMRVTHIWGPGFWAKQEEQMAA